MALNPVTESPLTTGAPPLFQFEGQRLDMKRASIALDVSNHIREVGFDDFIAAFLPRLNRNIQVDAKDVVTQLKKNYKDGWDWLSKRPKDSKQHENAAFSGLGNLFNAIINEGKKIIGKEPTLVYSSNPNNALTTLEYPNTSRPDAVFHKRGKNALDTNDVALCAEYKKQNTEADIKDNYEKITYSLHNAMRASPARRFVFGLTVADREWNIWWFSRAALVKTSLLNPITAVHSKSQAGSNNTDLEDMHLKLTQIILSFAFAEETELGWDQTVTKPDKENPLVYQFEVGKTKYTTVEELNMDGAYGLFGRGVRVYKVKDPKGTEAVLKDYWMDDNRSTERQIYDQIIADVKRSRPEFDVEMVKRHLITPIDDCFVRVNGVEDHTRDVIMHGSNVNINKITPWPGEKPGRPKTVTVQHKRHYRVVFKEFARPLSESTNYGNAFTALAGVLKVLKVIHGAGWVHRDISTSNIYEFKHGDEIIGKLGDLEYSKKTNDNSIHSSRTGTFDFMSSEAIAQRLLYLPHKTAHRPPFRHNDLHDMESFFWCAVWILFFLRPADIREDDDDKENRITATNSIFPGIMKRIDMQRSLRIDATTTTKVEDALSELAWSKLTPIPDIILILADLRWGFVQAYKEFEESLVQNNAAPGIAPQTVTDSDGLYQMMLTAFTDYGSLCKEFQVVPSQVNPNPKAHSLGLEFQINALQLQ